MTAAADWKPTACILCSRNCGLEVQLDGGRLAKIRGDERHPLSQGYLCQKAARLDHYQNHDQRLSSPLRRKSDGTYEPISWDIAVDEIAAKLVAIRDAHGGRALAYYGGGGQGNHLGGLYGRSLVAALGTRYHYSSLAQEKTGDFWVNGKLFGKQTCHVTEAVDDAELVILIGTNPWQAHGIRNARDAMRALGKSESRKLIVIDPKRTESAGYADLHLQLKPGTDAFLLSAILALLAREGGVNKPFIDARTTGAGEVLAALAEISVEEFAARAGVPLADVQTAARWIREAKSASVRVDLGLQQSLHSTLNSYLEKLLCLLPGHFGRHGCNTLHSFFVPLVGHSDDEPEWRTAATGINAIGKLYPPNVLPAEIESDGPDRLRALVVDSANPALSGADTRAYRAAFAKLELLVVIDVANTETARMAHYVLPAASQMEKCETTFFTLEFPTQALQIRRPLLPAREGTLPEPEIYRRLLVAMGELPAGGFPLLRAIAKLDRRAPKLRLLPLALRAWTKLKPRLAKHAAFALRDALGPTLPEGMEAAAPLWGAAHAYAQKHAAAVKRAGLKGEGADLGEALFSRLIDSPSGATISTHTYEEAWRFVRHADGRIHLAIPELLAELRALRSEAPSADAAFPLVLVAGERRAYNANLIFRDPAWRKADPDGALLIHPDDARALGLSDGARAICESRRGAVEVRVAISDALRPGLVTLPCGYGTDAGDGVNGPAVNLLTDAAHRDARTATPFHKHVPVRVRLVESR